MQNIPIFLPLVVGALAFAGTALIHALPLSATVNLVRHERGLGRVGKSFWNDSTIVGRVIFFAAVANLVEMAIWAGIFVLLGEFKEFGTAYYHSAVNFTTLGYGDIIMSPSWRLLGPMEGATGMLMFGVSTAMVFTVIQKLVETRFTDLKI